MSVICSTRGGGGLSYVGANNPAPLTIALSGRGIENQHLGVLIGAQVSQKVAAQFQNAMNQTIYITPFGDLPGDVALTFLINGPCSSAGPGFRSPALLATYVSKRLLPNFTQSTDPNADSTKILSLSISNALGSVGTLNLKGYIIGLSVNAVSQDTPMIQGTLLMKAWPA